jgi:hypothetical protein
LEGRDEMCPFPSPLYIGEARPRLPWPLLQALRPAHKGRRGETCPRVSPNPRGFWLTWALRHGVPGPLGLGCTPSAHVAPPGVVGAPVDPLEPSRNPLIFHRKIPELFRTPKNDFPYMKLIL